MIPYPFSYFSSIFTFRKSFLARKKLSWFQLIFTILFLIALPMIPLSIQIASRNSQPLDLYIDKVYSPLTKNTLKEFTHVQIDSNTLHYTGLHSDIQNNKGRVLLGHQDKIQIGNDLTLYFDTKFLKIYKNTKELAQIPYTGLDHVELTNRQLLTTALSKNWYQKNRIIINLFLTLGISFIVGGNFLILISGTTFFLALTRKSHFFSFQTIKECLNFTINCLGLPVIISSLLGLFGQPLTTVITLQNILFVLYLVITFYQTHYKE